MSKAYSMNQALDIKGLFFDISTKISDILIFTEGVHQHYPTPF
jgi:hypothetical protein